MISNNIIMYLCSVSLIIQKKIKVEESERQRDVSDERLLRPRDRPPPEKAPFREEEGQEQEQEAPPILSRGNKHLQTIWGKQKNSKFKKNTGNQEAARQKTPPGNLGYTATETLGSFFFFLLT